MQIIIAHSDKLYVERLRVFFSNLGISNIQVFLNGFETLEHIIKNQPKVVLIEENLPDLNANDIKKVLIIKRIKTKLLVVQKTSLLDTKIYQYSQTLYPTE